MKFCLDLEFDWDARIIYIEATRTSSGSKGQTSGKLSSAEIKASISAECMTRITILFINTHHLVFITVTDHFQLFLPNPNFVRQRQYFWLTKLFNYIFLQNSLKPTTFQFQSIHYNTIN